MFMKYLLLSLIIMTATISTTISAESKKKVAQVSAKSNTQKMIELGKIDEQTLNVNPESKTKEITDETALYAKPGKVKFSLNCKTKDGNEIKQGEIGYEDCLQKVKNDNSKNPNAPKAEIQINP